MIFIKVFELFTDLINIILIYIIIAILWMAAEKIIYGVITPEIIDDIVAFILAISIYLNINNIK